MEEKVTYVVEKDGNMWCAHYEEFENIQESPCAFGETKEIALLAFINNVAEPKINHHITKYGMDGHKWAEAWDQVNVEEKCYCINKRSIRLD